MSLFLTNYTHSLTFIPMQSYSPYPAERVDPLDPSESASTSLHGGKARQRSSRGMQTGNYLFLLTEMLLKRAISAASLGQGAVAPTPPILVSTVVGGLCVSSSEFHYT